jgi:hypothetical protein
MIAAQPADRQEIGLVITLSSRSLFCFREQGKVGGVWLFEATGSFTSNRDDDLSGIGKGFSCDTRPCGCHFYQYSSPALNQ